MKHLATYRVYYKGDAPWFVSGWETAHETDMPEDLNYLTGDLLYELLACEPCAKKVEIIINDELRDDIVFYHNLDLPVKISVYIEDVDYFRGVEPVKSKIEYFISQQQN